MEYKCVICGRSVKRSVTTRERPGKHVCIDCLNGLIFNTDMVEGELGPLARAFSKGVAAFKAEWESEGRGD